ncbi:hypothetical protein CA54_59600 [Symmachiella macrocystis]|uniref:Cytochrome c domain-containing protein n=1 Tax=Symmachiella macrocystis TaxID=2527985 RepID=A0A5C6B1I8_9PLAN|nr:DUF1549 and DUF1553 domain-containing protein [Symmachiella macrocystis]TWU05272.1 hypothetical protein CA54_59600 [Symmachiella macrocystis]
MSIRHLLWIIVTTTSMSLTAAPLRADEAPSDDVAQLAATIDRHIAAAWETQGVVPAPQADDAEFLRRTYLNIAGRIPPVSEVREFLADTDPNKRRQLVDRLLDHPGYVNHFAHTWRMLMIPEADVDQQAQVLAPSFEGWLRDKFIDNTAYDEMARELIACRISGNEREGAVAYYRAKEVKPESVSSSISRLFLGVQLDCAQCHNHPFAKWQQEEFWGFTAFFAGIEGDRFGSLSDDATSREISLDGSQTLVQARFIDETSPDWSGEARTRDVLADWITSKENPYFARTGANRIWAHFFGVGLVDPPDGFDESNPSTHPELLDDLARSFATHDFDFKFLIRAITASKTYQLSSRRTDDSQDQQRWIGRMPVKGMSPRQLADCLIQATGGFETSNPRNQLLGGRQVDTQIQALFENQRDSNVDPQSTILQALALMNCQFITQQTESASSNTLSAILQSPFLDMDGKIETLYLTTLSRQPREAELSRLRTYVETKAEEPAPRLSFVEAARSLIQPAAAKNNANKEKALADIFWALLNSSEFIFNH